MAQNSIGLQDLVSVSVFKLSFPILQLLLMISIERFFSFVVT